MIIYATKQTFERCKLKSLEELSEPMRTMTKLSIKRESGDKLLEWGAKIFYFDGRKCIQVVNFATKLTLFLIDIKVADLPNLGDIISYYLLELYNDDKKMLKALEKMFETSIFVCFEKLTDNSIIATLNSTQINFADDGNHFYEFIEDGILQTVNINKDINFHYPLKLKINGKKEYHYVGNVFKELVLERYGD